jgi:superfamily I DNA and RNA helicase
MFTLIGRTVLTIENSTDTDTKFESAASLTITSINLTRGSKLMIVSVIALLSSAFSIGVAGSNNKPLI